MSAAPAKALQPAARRLVVLSRAGDVWEEAALAPGASHRSPLLPGLVVRPEDLLGPGRGN